MTKARVLVSVADKTGIADLCRALSDQVEAFIASRGTAALLRDAGLPVTSLEELGSWPEMLDGRVKTLQPQIHGGILARREAAHLAELQARGLHPIDLVVVNLYPFEATVARPDVTWDEAMENVDIGGVALIRAAAKNHAHVSVLVDPNDYAAFAAAWRQGQVDRELRRTLAHKAFRRTLAYDAAIARFFQAPMASAASLPPVWQQDLVLLEASRYGENPQQQGGFYGAPDAALPFAQLHGKPMSFNNWLDLDGGWRAAQSFAAPTVAIVKHGNPCGIASAASLEQAYALALQSDPVSAFGGIVSCNRPVDAGTAERLAALFVEVLAAPDYAAEALTRLTRKKNLRILKARNARDGAFSLRSACGGVLVQETDTDRADLDARQWTCVTERQPTPAQREALAFAWHAARFVKSNAIVLAQGAASVGVGAGQMSRLDAVHLAVRKAGARAQGAVLASDAFFPFPDGLEAAADAGVAAVVQPGGSMRDKAVIQAANDRGLVMLHTGRRHFLH